MIVDSRFEPWPPLRNAHLQTLFASQVRPRPALSPRRERVELPDGDFVDVDWLGSGNGPVAVVLHGLTGSIRSKYVRGVMKELAAHGWRAALMHFRGASGEANRLARSYHSGDTGDVDFFLRRLARQEPNTPVALVGYSLGGNVALKWLGEQGDGAPVTAAVAVSVPFDLACAARRMQTGFSRLYQRHLLQGMRTEMRRKHATLPQPIRCQALRRFASIEAFDDAVTAPLNGFRDAADYYRRASCRAYIPGIRRPTLILHALDDPFMFAAAVPRAEELPPAVTLELSRHGGHVGFIGGRGLRPVYWLEQRIPAFLRSQIAR